VWFAQACWIGHCFALNKKTLGWLLPLWLLLVAIAFFVAVTEASAKLPIATLVKLSDVRAVELFYSGSQLALLTRVNHDGSCVLTIESAGLQ
jgi:formate hydrogenlyase subunit 4